MKATVADETQCALGEGPLWHPTRGQLFWFDIVRFRLHTAGRHWQFDEHVSAAGWVDSERVLVASETKLFLFDLSTASSEPVAPLEAGNPATRSNDGRADPWGGFWIGTMGKAAEERAGSIYRYHGGELRELHPGITIPNAICFSPDRRHAYFADTTRRMVWRQPLAEADGWPAGDAEVFLDLAGDGLNPDGAVTDALGNFWNAQWGASRVACYAPDGRFLRAVPFGAAHTSCPAFGGEGLTTLYCTTARQGLSAETLADNPRNGMTFSAEGLGPGAPEPGVIL